MMNILQKFATFCLAVVLLTVGLGGGVGVASTGGLLDEIQSRGKLRVGMSTFVPWAMRDIDGKLIGFEIDVATKVAADMQVEVEFIPTAWNEIIPALLAKKFDVVISGLSITPQRNLRVNFTIPYAHSGQQMAASKQLAGQFSSKDDFNSSDVVIACRRSATPCEIARDMFPKASIRRFDDEAQTFLEVVNGKAHAVIASAPQPFFWSIAHPSKVFMPFGDENLTKSDEAFALRKGDVDSLNFFSNWIRVNTSNGWLNNRHDFWFKNQPAWKHLVDLHLVDLNE